MIFGLSPLDLIVLMFFLVAWLGFSPFARWKLRHLKAAAAMIDHRRAWMNAMLGRESRESDTIICGNIMNSGSFFASAAVVVTGALLGVLVEIEGASGVRLPISERFLLAPRHPLEIKVLLILLLALCAFIGFTWSIRQANYLNVVIGAAPPAPVEPELRERIAADMGDIISHVAASYDAGMRAYYFGLGAVGWIVSPWLFAIATAGIVALLLRRQMRSTTARALQHIATARARDVQETRAGIYRVAKGTTIAQT